MHKYYSYTVKKLITVQHLITIEYLQTLSDFSYPEETHSFYELVFVEKGELLCQTDNESVDLCTNDFYLVAPNTRHSYHTKDKKTASVFIVCFQCKSTIVNTIQGKSAADDTLRFLIEKILNEAKETFCFPFDNKLQLLENTKIGSQQLIENYIEELLIKMIQKHLYLTLDIQVVKDSTEIKQSIVKEIYQFLNQNLYKKISLTDISHFMFYSKTYLNNVFKEATQTTIMQRFQIMKTEEATKLLQDGKTISEISELLGFESPHYFSKIFKKHMGVPPSVYQTSKLKNSQFKKKP